MKIIIFTIFLLFYLYLEQKIKQKLFYREMQIYNFLFYLVVLLISEYLILSYIYINFFFFSILFNIIIHYFIFRNIIKFLTLKIYFYFFTKLDFLVSDSFRMRFFILFFQLKLKYFYLDFLINYLLIMLLLICFINNFLFLFILYYIIACFKFFFKKLHYEYDGLIYNYYCNNDIIITNSGYEKLTNYIDYLFDINADIQKLYIYTDLMDIPYSY